jgi:DNA repair protein RecN (Recombination protein N)
MLFGLLEIGNGLICRLNMLSRLSIKNYAIIHELELEFSSNLNIITGETGAGKSIIAGALGLILGQRADSNVLLKKDKKCIVEGCFRGELSDDHVVNFLKEYELDIHDELVVRREIATNGKSRAFINDTPVNLSQLNQLSSLLVDLHQQFDTLELSESNFQMEVVDALAGNLNLLKSYRLDFGAAQSAKKNLKILKDQKAQFNKEFDYHQFQFNELDEANFKENELEELDLELKSQTNAEEIKKSLSQIYYELEESNEPILRKIKSMIAGLQPYTEIQHDFPNLVQRLQSIYIELQDVADEADRVNNHVSADPEKIERINDRLSLGYRLLKKHGVKSTNELLEIKRQLNEKLQAVLNIDEAINNAEKEFAQLIRKSEEQATIISEARVRQLKPLEAQVNKMLIQVGMPNARLKVEIKRGNLSYNGLDEIEFLFDANKSNQFQLLRKVASGGELSRLMLCVKSLIAKSMDLPTLIFDEIDTGISGEAAKQVGIIMKELSSARQVICITHQPQIAGKADAHFLVYKAVKNDAVTTAVRLLNKDERIVAIAKMLSGEKPTAAALENAREMIMN